MPLMERNEHGVFVDVSKVPVPEPQPSKVEPVKEVTYEVKTVSYPLTEEGIADLVAETGVDDVPTRTIDCSNVPKGTWGRTKVEAWYADNGLPVSANAEKNELVAAAKKLCKDQEQS